MMSRSRSRRRRSPRSSSGSTSAGSHTGVRTRLHGLIYFDDPLGLLIELAAYRFEPPHGHTHADVLFEAHKLRTERGESHITAQEHLADAIELLGHTFAAVALRRPRAEEPVLTRGSRRAHRGTWPKERLVPEAVPV